MTTCITFTVPGPPQPKERARTVTRNGRTRTVTPKRTRAYEQWVGACAARAIPAGWELDGEFSLEIQVFYADRRRRDLDNVVKSLLDGCNGVVYRDDSDVWQFAAERGQDATNPRVEMSVVRYERGELSELRWRHA